jgi:tetratricopeptide (TPR) repeat protein
MTLDPKRLASEAAALKAAGKLDEAIAIHRRIVTLTPNSAVAEHNLAGILGTAGRWREAETHIRSAFAKGIDAPESWLILARCAQSLSRFDEAERTFLEAIRRRPMLLDAQKELAQLRWMRWADRAQALAELDKALAQAPSDSGLIVVKARVLQHAGDLKGAFALLAVATAQHPHDLPIVTAAAQIASELGDVANSVALAERAFAIASHEPIVKVTLISALLLAGDALRASVLCEDLRRQAPNDQHALALQAITWRLLGDARYRDLYDYGTFVSACTIDTPQGWADLDAYLADLAPALRALHGFTTHPFHQSVRHGSQAPDVLHSDDPAIKALPQALDGPIRRYIAKLGKGPDPVRARNLGGYVYQGMWSVRLTAGGFHIDHVHPQGWLSSACYIEVPGTLSGKEGWLKFGEPGIPTTPAMAAEHFVEPKAGKLVLFPSYMWHGTVPFADNATRLSIAFDLVPAPDHGGGASG